MCGEASDSEAIATLHCHPLPALSLAGPGGRGCSAWGWHVWQLEVLLVGVQRVCWAASFHELFISYGREAVINNTLALSHSACMCLQINISFSRNTQMPVDK